MPVVDVTVAQMTGVWERVLHRPVEDQADFFLDLAGDSLKALQLTDAVGAEFGVPVDVSDLFDCPNAATLADLVRQRRGGGA